LTVATTAIDLSRGIAHATTHPSIRRFIRVEPVIGAGYCEVREEEI